MGQSTGPRNGDSSDVTSGGQKDPGGPEGFIRGGHGHRSRCNFQLWKKMLLAQGTDTEARGGLFRCGGCSELGFLQRKPGLMMALAGECGFSHDKDITDRLGKDWAASPQTELGAGRGPQVP